LSAENEITFRNIDVSQFQEVIAVVNIEKQEEAVLEANTVGSMVRFVHFIVDNCFLVVYAIIGTLFQFCFQLKELHTVLVFDYGVSFVLYFQLWNLSFKTLGNL
jgi:hypothetical protein